MRRGRLAARAGFDRLGDAGCAAVGYRYDRVQDGVDELDDLGALVHDECDDVDDALDRSDEGGGGVEEGRGSR
ncbi:hypothetical protein SANTM175S_00290 [Streptomyces antimycoticus]